MSTGVEASTISAAQLFSSSVFSIPDFQREYAWGVEGEVEDFWQDLRSNIDAPPYFLGLLIMTDEKGRRIVVDGQQRITTLTLLANSIRKIALSHGRNLIADSMRDVFLFHLDYETETRSPRIVSTSGKDSATLRQVLTEQQSEDPTNSIMLRAQADLDKWLRNDIDTHEPGKRLAEWARFLSAGLTFALFEHPDRNSAFKVYEVVNTRGRDLTPAELIKSFLISQAPEPAQKQIYARWIALEQPFVAPSGESQFTQFIRHIVTLHHGYILPRDLYQGITRWYSGLQGAEQLLCELEEEFSTYLQFIDPSSDDQPLTEITGQTFAVLGALGVRTVRPIFIAAARSSEPELALQMLLKIVVSRLALGSFGTGSIERRFADAASLIHHSAGDSWKPILETLSEDLTPPANAFMERVAEASHSRGLLHVLRASVLQQTALPSLSSFIHQVRPKNAEDWPGFDDAEYRRLGGTLGNTILLQSERRPRNTNTLKGAQERLFPGRDRIEDSFLNYSQTDSFTADEVEEFNRFFAGVARVVWYGANS